MTDVASGFGSFKEENKSSSEQFASLKEEINNLTKRLDAIAPLSGRSSDVSTENQDISREIVNSKLADSLWRNIFYTSAFTPFTVIVTSATEVNERFQDTTIDRFLSTDRPARLRTTFYFGDAGLGANATTYITTMHVRKESGTIPILDSGAEFVGLKIVDNKVYLCSYIDPLPETLIDINMTIVADQTVVLEVQFYPQERADFYIDNKYVGSITKNLPGENKPVIFFPLFCSMKRSDSLGHKLNIEYFEFIQDRK